MTTKRTGLRALGLLAGSALALSACATSSSGGAGSSSSATTAPKTFTWAYEQEFSSYNPNSSDGAASANTVVLNQVQRGFYVFAPDGTITPDTDFGTYQKTSDNPLTVKYAFNDKAAWSDGKPIDCDDAVLTWLSRSGVTGDKGFASANSAGYQDMNPPACKAGEKAFTITYKKPFADWIGMFGPTEILPAHIVEQAAGMTKTFVDYANDPTSADLAKAITFWNSGWQFNPGELKPDITPSSGPYSLSAWQAGQSFTLVANDKWWGTPPKVKTIVLRYIGGTEQAQALQNGEANVMNPQPQVDIVNQLKALGDKAKVTNYDIFTFEHLDMNFKTVFKDKNVREAFAKCVPRQQIIDNLLKPTNPNAQIMQSRFVYPFQDAYAQFKDGVGGQNFNTVDLAGAKDAIAKSGVKTPITVRVGWRKDPAALNKRRQDQLALIQASCNQAGFKIVDAGTPTFFEKEQPAGNFDVAMFAWAGSSLVTGNDGIYNTGGGQNFIGYSNPQIDQLSKQLDTSLTNDAQVQVMKQMDTVLWSDLATIPLYVFPGIMATGTNVEGVQANSTNSDLSWNAFAWNLRS